ncbi:NAD-dependent succinate-semialdehyde dehydrogenase [Gordonia sp. PS3]|uniref:NAD-dependent succinate-semialdehyde dehydrogenase n=1 Tax=Gordonia TaxID=2053 RepID=UPI001C92BBCC|nr:NAD-dependent succinate-semialdehyde dehydrogenase [Gordonia sihwensis]MBY4569625.1 NAD-dependent succinate-semialdehyde dehydrogenase [Gordonia sihwensis]
MTRSVADIIAGLGTGIHIDGRWRQASSGSTFDVENPATGEVLATLADGGESDAVAAIDSAAAHQREWAATPARERSEILRRAYELLTERADEVAAVMTAEMGKPLAESRGEVAYGAEFFRWFAEEAVRIRGDARRSPDGKSRIIVTQEPVGPCILITPWNFPLAMVARKIGPAIAAGCTMVYKPASLTPLTSLYVTDLLREAGLPDGVLSVVCTSSAGSVVEPWIDSGKARKLSFTGSTGVGKSLLEQCARGVLRTSMELGGNAPFIVCEDADLDVAIEAVLAAKMRNMGEACTAANRILVHRSVIGDFAGRLTTRMSELTVGDGAVDGTDVGPLVNRAAVDKVDDLVRDAVSRGAEVLCGGERPEGRGWFYPPTVLTGVASDAEMVRTEIFGPVAALVPFDSDDEAVELANNTEFGLVSYVMTESADRGFSIAERLETGMVGFNTGLVSNPAAPFGGVKQSGLGREGGFSGIDEFLETKYVAMPVRNAT